jgi:uncharacterized protein (DUF983 family)
MMHHRVSPLMAAAEMSVHEASVRLRYAIIAINGVIIVTGQLQLDLIVYCNSWNYILMFLSYTV